jgi:hypothetical protein
MKGRIEMVGLQLLVLAWMWSAKQQHHCQNENCRRTNELFADSVTLLTQSESLLISTVSQLFCFLAPLALELELSIFRLKKTYIIAWN